MMFILFIFFLINNSQSLEWNCTENKHHVHVANNQLSEQCTITIEYISLQETQQQDKQVCLTHTLAIKNLPLPSFSSNYTMKSFKLNFCQLITLSQLPFSLPSTLEKLDLSHNLLSTFTLSYPLPTHLQYLYLDHNPNLVEINLGHQQQLIGLSLRHNKHIQLSSLPVNLMQLDLTDCNLLQSPMLIVLKSLTRLTHLSLADNRLEQVPTLDRSVQLTYLNLSMNYFTRIDDSWLYKSLRILDLTFNRVKSLDFFKERLKTNQTLKQNNYDQTISTPILQLSLHGNPLICDCWLDSLLNSSSVNIIDSSLLQCNSRSILNISSDDLQCSYTRHCASDCTCCDFEACDCHFICPSECLCSHDALWSHHLVKCRHVNLSHIHLLLPETITELNYEGNHIEQIKPFVFVGKSSLTKLNLANNNIQQLTNETFCAASNLREINLSYNSNLIKILPNMNELFGCLKDLRDVILSNEQFNAKDSVSYGWIVNTYDGLIHVIRMTKQSSLVSSLNNTFHTTRMPPSTEFQSQPSTLFSVLHQESFTTSSIIQHNQTLIVIVFFLLFFVLLFLLLLIALAICRRKLRRHITAELERQRSQHYYYQQHPNLHQPSIKIPENLPINESLYEQLPSLSSDSEQPFLYNDRKLNAPALPPYPPPLHHYHCCHSTIKGYSSTSNLQQQHSCQAVLILGSQLIYPSHQEYFSELQQNLLLNQPETNTIHYCNNETVFVPTTTLCRCHNQMKNIDTYVHR